MTAVLHRPIKVLLQTTIPTTFDNWSINRFRLLAQLLRDSKNSRGEDAFEVVMRDRDPLGSPDTVLSKLAETAYDEMWLFAVDTGDGLTKEDCAGISRFRREGRGLLVTRDHMDWGPRSVVWVESERHITSTVEIWTRILVVE